MKQLLPEYDRQSDGVDYIAINCRAGTNLGRALSLGAGYYLQTRYNGNFQSLGGLVRYLNRSGDPFARVATGREQDMEIAAKFDDTHTGTFIKAMWSAVGGVEWLTQALVDNKLPFVYFVDFDDGEGLVPVQMPDWYSEALAKCVSNARAGKFVKQAEKPAVPGPLQPWSFPSTPVRGEEPSLLEQYVEKELKPRRERKTTKVTTSPTIDLNPGVAEVGEPGREVSDMVILTQLKSCAVPKQRLTKTANRAVATKMDMVMVGRTSNDSTTYLGKNEADIQLWFKRLQALSVEQKALVDQILEPFDDLVGKPVPDEEIRDTHLPLMLKMLENIKDKQVADSIARGVWTYVFDAPYGTEEVIAKLQSYYVPEEE